MYSCSTTIRQRLLNIAILDTVEQPWTRRRVKKEAEPVSNEGNNDPDGLLHTVHSRVYADSLADVSRKRPLHSDRSIGQPVHCSRERAFQRCSLQRRIVAGLHRYESETYTRKIG